MAETKDSTEPAAQQEHRSPRVQYGDIYGGIVNSPEDEFHAEQSFSRRLILTDPERAFDWAKANAAEWNDNPIRQANDNPIRQAEVFESFAETAHELAVFHPEDLRFEKLAARAERLAQELRSNEQPAKAEAESSKPDEIWPYTDKAFAYFCWQLCELGIIQRDTFFDSKRKEISWKLLCSHFARKNGKEFNPKHLSKMLSDIEAEKSRIESVRHKSEVDHLVREVQAGRKYANIFPPKIVTEHSTPSPNFTPERIACDLSASGVLRSAPGRVGSERRSERRS